MVTQYEMNLVRLHGHYRNRLLFTEGGLMSQPNYYLEAMELIEEVSNSAS